MHTPFNAPCKAVPPYNFELYEEYDEDPFFCPLSKHPDGQHDKVWFNGGICGWCGKR